MTDSFIAISNHNSFRYYSLTGRRIYLKKDFKFKNDLKNNRIYFASNHSITILGEIENNILSILLTTLCNQNCIMCPQRLNDDFMEHDAVIDIFIDKIRYLSVSEIYITGGEPFLKKNLIERIFNATKRNIKITILTNGTIVPSDIILESKRISLCVPLYGSFDELHNVLTESKNFYRVVSNLIQISYYHIPIELRFVITKQNYQNLPAFAMFVYRNLPFVTNIAFMGIELMENCYVNKDSLWVTPADFRPYLYEALDYLQIFDMPVSIYNMPHCLIDIKYHPLLYKSISEWKRKYFSFCTACKFKTECGGFFESDSLEYKELIEEPVYEENH